MFLGPLTVGTTDGVDAVGHLWLDKNTTPATWKMQTDVGPVYEGMASPAGGLVYADGTTPGGNTVANTGSETAFASGYTFAANTLAAGSIIRIKAFGLYGTALVAPTLRGRLKFGSVTALDTGVLSTLVGSVNGVGWWAEASVYLISTGSTDAQGFAEFATAATTGLSVNMVNAAPVAIDFTSSQALTLTVLWGTADAANTITLKQLVIEVLKVPS